MKIRHRWTLVALLATTGCATGPRGRYVDPGRFYIEFASSGKAFTNIGAGGGESQIAYEVEGTRVTLHTVDGNPTLQLQKDGSLCCGPGGLLRQAR